MTNKKSTNQQEAEKIAQLLLEAVAEAKGDEKNVACLDASEFSPQARFAVQLSMMKNQYKCVVVYGEENVRIYVEL